jgi:hypothetical protein
MCTFVVSTPARDLHKAGWTLAEKALSQEEGRELAEAISKIEEP